MHLHLLKLVETHRPMSADSDAGVTTPLVLRDFVGVDSRHLLSALSPHAAVLLSTLTLAAEGDQPVTRRSFTPQVSRGRTVTIVAGCHVSRPQS